MLHNRTKDEADHPSGEHMLEEMYLLCGSQKEEREGGEGEGDWEGVVKQSGKGEGRRRKREDRSRHKTQP